MEIYINNSIRNSLFLIGEFMIVAEFIIECQSEFALILKTLLILPILIYNRIRFTT